MGALRIKGRTVQGEWVPMKDFPNYAINDSGEVINSVTGMIRTVSHNQQGIALVNLSRAGKQYVRSLAVLVAEHFLYSEERPPHFDTPIHLDGDRDNCRIDNLSWRPRWFARAYHQQFDPIARARSFGFKRPVEIMDTGEVFPTSWEAAVKYGLLDHEIYLAVSNRTVVFPHNFIFRVVEEF